MANSCTLPDCAWSAGLVQSKNLSSKKASRWKSPRIERPIGAWETASFYRKLTGQAGDNCPSVITKVFMKDIPIIALNVYQVDFKSSESNWIDILDHKLSTFFTAWTSQPPHPFSPHSRHRHRHSKTPLPPKRLSDRASHGALLVAVGSALSCRNFE